jgi:hypothetical protein
VEQGQLTLSEHIGSSSRFFVCDFLLFAAKLLLSIPEYLLNVKFCVENAWQQETKNVKTSLIT